MSLVKIKNFAIKLIKCTFQCNKSGKEFPLLQYFTPKDQVRVSNFTFLCNKSGKEFALLEYFTPKDQVPVSNYVASEDKEVCHKAHTVHFSVQEKC
jgi:hypothetical protein